MTVTVDIFQVAFGRSSFSPTHDALHGASIQFYRAVVGR